METGRETKKKQLKTKSIAAELVIGYIGGVMWNGQLNLHSTLEIATAQRTRPRAVVGAPCRAAWQLKSAFCIT